MKGNSRGRQFGKVSREDEVNCAIASLELAARRKECIRLRILISRQDAGTNECVQRETGRWAMVKRGN